MFGKIEVGSEVLILTQGIRGTVCTLNRPLATVIISYGVTLTVKVSELVKIVKVFDSKEVVI